MVGVLGSIIAVGAEVGHRRGVRGEREEIAARVEIGGSGGGVLVTIGIIIGEIIEEMGGVQGGVLPLETLHLQVLLHLLARDVMMTRIKERKKIALGVIERKRNRCQLRKLMTRNS